MQYIIFLLIERDLFMLVLHNCVCSMITRSALLIFTLLIYGDFQVTTCHIWLNCVRTANTWLVIYSELLLYQLNHQVCRKTKPSLMQVLCYVRNGTLPIIVSVAVVKFYSGTVCYVVCQSLKWKIICYSMSTAHTSVNVTLHSFSVHPYV